MIYSFGVPSPILLGAGLGKGTFTGAGAFATTSANRNTREETARNGKKDHVRMYTRYTDPRSPSHKTDPSAMLTSGVITAVLALTSKGANAFYHVPKRSFGADSTIRATAWDKIWVKRDLCSFLVVRWLLDQKDTVVIETVEAILKSFHVDGLKVREISLVVESLPERLGLLHERTLLDPVGLWLTVALHRWNQLSCCWD